MSGRLERVPILAARLGPRKPFRAKCPDPGNLPRAIAPAGTPVETPATPTKPVSSPTASNDDNTNGWQIAALGEAAVLAAFALGGAALVARRQHRAPHMGV